MNQKSFPEVQLGVGRVVGFWRDDSAAFLGIPFAEPPVGDLRFAAPVPVRELPQPFMATEFGSTAQRKPLYEVTTIPEPSIQGESVLNVNVFTPEPANSGAKLPVLVWIHGGGFIAGSPASPWYDGKRFNESDTVVVTVSYRLGIQGFAPLDGAVANRGLLDLVESLRWVKANIAAFGGNPENVTIGGQSAGGALVLDLMAMPLAKGLFHKVLSISPCTASRTREIATLETQQLAELAGVSNNLEGWSRLSEAEILAVEDRYRESILVGNLSDLAIHLDRSATDNQMHLACQPFVDGEVLPHDPIQAFKLGVGDEYSLVIGATSEEFVAPQFVSVDKAGSLDWLRKLKRSEAISPAVDAVLANEANEHDPMGRVLTQTLFRDTVRSAALNRKRDGVKTWIYDFDWKSQVSLRAQHCIDLPFAWNLLDAEGVSVALGQNPPQKLADAMHQSWLGLMKENQPGWNTFGESGVITVFDESGSTPIIDAKLEHFSPAKG